MGNMVSDEGGITIEQPMASEVDVRLDEPKPRPSMSTTEFDKVRKWKARIEVARMIRDNRLHDISTLIDYYEGIQWHADDEIILKDRTTVNLIFSNIKKELPYLYFQNPTPIVNPKRPEFELGAFALQKLLENYTKYNLKTELKKHVRLAILDAKFAFGCLKITYTPRFSPNPNKGQPLFAGYDDLGEPIFIIDEEGNIVTELDEIVTSELYYIERCSPREILIDPICRNFPERAGWVAQEIVKPVKYIKDNKLYKNTEFLERNIEFKEIFERRLNKRNEEVSAVNNFIDEEDTQLVRFVEIYDLKNEELLCLPDNEDFFIREEDVYLNPFTFLKFNESPDNFYPIPDVRIEKPLQQEINIGRSMMITHARRAARKYAYDQSTFSGLDEEEELEKAKNPEDMAFFKVSDLQHIPQPLGMATQDPAVFQDLYQSRIDFNEVTGTTEMQRGVVERRKTKGEASYQESHATVRRGDKQSLVADFVEETYRKLAEIMQKTMTVPQAIKIQGNTGIFWSEVQNSDIQGDFWFDIEVSEMRPQVPELDRAELSEFIFALSNFITAILNNPVGPMVFNIQGMIKEFSKSYPSINVENILNTQVTPEQIAQLVMMQIQGKQGGQQQ